MIIAWLMASTMASGMASGASGAVDQAPVAPRVQVAPAKTIDGLWTELGAAIQADDYGTALVITKAFAEHPDYAAQPVERRNAATILLGLLYASEGQDAAALPYLIEASERPGATPDIWLTRITSHARTGDRTAAARALTRFLPRYPDEMATLSTTFILQLEQDTDVDAGARFELRLALRDAGWRDRYDNWTWIRLIDDLLQRDRLDEATPLAARVSDSSALIRLHAMRRYDALRAAGAMPELDIAAVLDAELVAQRAEAEAPGAEFEARNAWATILFERGRFEEALAVSDATLALPAPAPDSEDDRSLTWTMDGRARQLMELGRPDEAIAQMEIAAKRNEGAGVNVSQTINLGWFYLRAGRNTQAIEAVKSLEPGTASPFGVMQAMHVRACAGAALGNAGAAGLAFTHMEQNWRDAPLTWVEAQACRGDADGAADTLLLILADEELSERAVAALHTYQIEQNATDFDRRTADVLSRAFARPDVIAARDRIARGLVLPIVSGQF